MDLRGKTVCVTGATGGIGEECAAALAGLGATVVLGVRSRKKAADTLARIREKYPGANVVEGAPLDMSDPDSIRAFAGEWERSGRPLHILINNAGALTFSQECNQRGVPQLCQVNYLGPYLLSRLLEGVLIRSAPSRVVNVSSVTHRYGVIGDPWGDFLRGPQGHWPALWIPAAWYRNLEGFLPHATHYTPGVGAASGGCAPPAACRHRRMAPPPSADVAAHKGGGQQAQQAETLRYYAPQAFALPLLTWYSPEGNQGRLGRWLLRRGVHASSLGGVLKQGVWLALAFMVAGLDWPVRQLSKGSVWGGVVLSPSSPLSYDRHLAAQLWDASADVAGVGRDVQEPVERSRGSKQWEA